MNPENVIPFPQIINPMRFMQMPRVTTELLRDELIDLESYKRIADAMAADVTFLFSVANDFFTEQFDAAAMAEIAGLLSGMAEMVAVAGQNDLAGKLHRAALKLDRLADRLTAMESKTPC